MNREVIVLVARRRTSFTSPAAALKLYRDAVSEMLPEIIQGEIDIALGTSRGRR